MKIVIKNHLIIQWKARFFKMSFKAILTLLMLFFQIMAFGQIDLDFSNLTSESDTVKLADSIPDKPLEIEQIIEQNEKALDLLQNIQVNLLKSYDTTFLEDELPIIQNVLERVKEQILIRESRINLQLLNELENLLRGYETQISRWQDEAAKRSSNMLESGEELKAIQQIALRLPNFEDTTFLSEYMGQGLVLAEKLSQVDSIYTFKRLSSLQTLTQLSALRIQISELEEDISTKQQDFRNSLLERDGPAFWENIYEIRDFKSIIHETWLLNRVILKYYLIKWVPLISFLFISFLLLIFWFRGMVKKINRTKAFSNMILERSKYITFSPTTSAAMVVLSLAPYLFRFPPYGLTVLLLFGTILCTTILIRTVLDKPSFFLWVLMVVSFVIYGGSNLITSLAYQEKWYLLAFSGLGLWIGIYLLNLITKKPETYPEYLPALVYFYLFVQTFSILFHIFGRFSLGKMLGVAATLSAMQGICLYIFVLVVMEAIYLKSELSKQNQKEYTNYLNYQAIYKRLKGILSFLAVLMWFYFLTLNFSLNEFLTERVLEVINTPRHVGNTTFTFGSILLFVFVIWLSTVLAKNIAYFASIRDSQKADEREKRLGSSILLIRLFVLTVGFFIAITTSGISLDKLTIVIGALSVGIGFGLQTIVNNLVSGIILAFERPIQIGDAIEVGTQSGIVKEVGIRSSTLQAYDGSEVIIPNGDLLSQHLINWTLSNKSRRIELIIGVAYGSEIEKVHTILKKILEGENILRIPEPAVLLHNFADSAVEFRVLFWVGNFSQWLSVKNDVLREIYASFYKEGIVIPFPQRDLHIKNGQPEKQPAKKMDKTKKGE